MWLVLPIGHDQGIRHFPWVTASIAALCVLVQVQRSVSGPSEENLIAVMEEAADIEDQLLTRHLRATVKPHSVRNWEALQAQMQSLQEQRVVARAALRAGKLTESNDPLYQRWMEVRDREQRLLRRDIAYQLAYRPKEGVSAGLGLSAFAHAGWLHLLGNMLFLYLVGCNLEDRWGRKAFTLLYLAGAIVSGLTFYLWHRHTETLLIGASGAVAAAMGAFLVCFHRARINFLVWSPTRGAHISEIYAFWVFPVWFIQQLLNSWLEARMNVGVAYSAHVGGFVLGLAMAGLLKVTGIERRHLLPATAAGTEWKEDSDYLFALERVAAADLSGAVTKLQAVLARQPRHQGALEQLARTALILGERELAARAVSDFLVELGRTRLPEVLPLVRELGLLELPLALSDRAGLVVVRAAASADQPELMVKAALRLLREHPTSPLAPGVMWDVARLQERLGRTDLARGTLQQLVARYPDDPFAVQARRRLPS